MARAVNAMRQIGFLSVSGGCWVSPVLVFVPTPFSAPQVLNRKKQKHVLPKMCPIWQYAKAYLMATLAWPVLKWQLAAAVSSSWF